MRTNAVNRALVYLSLGASLIWLTSVVLKHQSRRRQLNDECLRVDEELDESFPASDPPSHSSPLGAQAGR